MEELFFVPSITVNSKVSELVMEGKHIIIDGISYKRLSRKPRGRSIKKKLMNNQTGQTLIIYQ